MLYWRIYSFVARLSTQKVSRNKMLIIDTTVKYFTENRHGGTTSAICQLSNNPVESLGIVSLYRILGLFLLVFCSMSFVFSFTIFSRRLYLFWPLCTVLSLLLRLLLTQSSSVHQSLSVVFAEIHFPPFCASAVQCCLCTLCNGFAEYIPLLFVVCNMLQCIKYVLDVDVKSS